MLRELIKIANKLDELGLTAEGSAIDAIIEKIVNEEPSECGEPLETELYYLDNLSNMHQNGKLSASDDDSDDEENT